VNVWKCWKSGEISVTRPPDLGTSDSGDTVSDVIAPDVDSAALSDPN
jgi:hypothetical protein